MSPSISWAQAIGIALVAGAAGGLIGRMTAPAPKVASASVPIAREDSPRDPDLAKRADELERRLGRLERERAVAPRASGDAPEAKRPSVDDPVFQAAVRDAMEQIEEERRGERQARNDERISQAATRAAERLSTELSLNDDQKQKVAELAQKLSKDLRDLRDSDAGAGAFDRARELRAGAEASLARVLDKTQLEKYQALDDGEKLGARGRRGGN